MAKKERGLFDSTFDKNDEILTVKWYDNAMVCLATNFESVEPLQNVRRIFTKLEETCYCDAAKFNL